MRRGFGVGTMRLLWGFSAVMLILALMADTHMTTIDLLSGFSAVMLILALVISK